MPGKALSRRTTTRAFPAFGALMVCVKVSKVAPVLVGPAQPTATVRATIANGSRQDFIAVAVRTQRTHFCVAARIGSRVVLMTMPPLDPAPVHLRDLRYGIQGAPVAQPGKGSRPINTFGGFNARVFGLLRYPRLVARMERSEIRDPPHNMLKRSSRITRSLSSGRPTGSGLWPARWQAPPGPGGAIRATAAGPQCTVAACFGLGGKAGLASVPRRSPSAVCNALSSLVSLGT